jgi:hypothetical protein
VVELSELEWCWEKVVILGQRLYLRTALAV